MSVPAHAHSFAWIYTAVYLYVQRACVNVLHIYVCVPSVPVCLCVLRVCPCMWAINPINLTRWKQKGQYNPMDAPVNRIDNYIDQLEGVITLVLIRWKERGDGKERNWSEGRRGCDVKTGKCKRVISQSPLRLRKQMVRFERREREDQCGEVIEEERVRHTHTNKIREREERVLSFSPSLATAAENYMKCVVLRWCMCLCVWGVVWGSGGKKRKKSEKTRKSSHHHPQHFSFVMQRDVYSSF